MPFTSKPYPILIIIGPSGAGKSSVVQKLAEEGLVVVNPSWTTRPPRPGELEETTEHRFVSEAEFDKAEREGRFLETVQMFGLPYWYGLAPVQASTPEQVSIVMLRAPLLTLANKHYPSNLVYQIEDDLARIKQRLEQRQAHGEPLGTRLSDYEKEVSLGGHYAKRRFVNNDDITLLANQIRQALQEDFQ
jgi:guanylate kinase